MTKVKFIRAAFALVIFGLAGNAAFAQGNDNPDKQQGQQLQMDDQSNQTNVSDAELKKFAKVMNEVRSLRREQRPKMQQAVKDAGLTMQEYRSIQRKMRGRGGGIGGSGSEKEQDKPSKAKQQKFQEAQKNIRKIQQSMKKTMEKKIKAKGLTQSRFREISRAIRSDKSLQQKVRKYQKNQSGGGTPGAR